jgi:hypothetical protein
MTTPDIALARRFWMHVHEGGTLTSLDVGRMVTALEDLDTAFSNLHREYERRGDTIAELEAKLRKSALQELSALGQASEAYQAQLAAEAKLELIQEEWAGAVYGDLENGVASLNAAAATDFYRRYPLVSSFGETLNRIIDGDTP